MTEVKQSHLRIFNFCFSVCFALLLIALIEVTSACICGFGTPPRAASSTEANWLSISASPGQTNIGKRIRRGTRVL